MPRDDEHWQSIADTVGKRLQARQPAGRRRSTHSPTWGGSRSGPSRRRSAWTPHGLARPGPPTFRRHRAHGDRAPRIRCRGPPGIRPRRSRRGISHPAHRGSRRADAETERRGARRPLRGDRGHRDGRHGDDAAPGKDGRRSRFVRAPDARARRSGALRHDCGQRRAQVTAQPSAGDGRRGGCPTSAAWQRVGTGDLGELYGSLIARLGTPSSRLPESGRDQPSSACPNRSPCSSIRASTSVCASCSSARTSSAPSSTSAHVRGAAA